jgi:hypothetical protein
MDQGVRVQRANSIKYQATHSACATKLVCFGCVPGEPVGRSRTED